MDVDLVLGGVVAKLVGRAIGQSGLHPAPHPNSKATASPHRDATEIHAIGNEKPPDLIRQITQVLR